MNRDEQRAWDEFVQHAREDAIAKITDSAVVVSLLPGGDVDVKVCLEIGAAVLLDKPILAVAIPGRPVPAAMQRLATHVIEADLETDEGREAIALAIQQVLGEIGNDAS